MYSRSTALDVAVASTIERNTCASDWPVAGVWTRGKSSVSISLGVQKKVLQSRNNSSTSPRI